MTGHRMEITFRRQSSTYKIEDHRMHIGPLTLCYFDVGPNLIRSIKRIHVTVLGQSG